MAPPFSAGRSTKRSPYSPLGGDPPLSAGRPAIEFFVADRLPQGGRCAPPPSPSAAARLRRGTGRSRALCPDGFFAPPRSSREARRGGGRPPDWRYPSVIMVKVGSMPVQQEVCSRHCPEAPRATPPAAAAPSPSCRALPKAAERLSGRGGRRRAAGRSRTTRRAGLASRSRRHASSSEEAAERARRECARPPGAPASSAGAAAALQQLGSSPRGSQRAGAAASPPPRLRPRRASPPRPVTQPRNPAVRGRGRPSDPPHLEPPISSPPAVSGQGGEGRGWAAMYLLCQRRRFSSVQFSSVLSPCTSCLHHKRASSAGPVPPPLAADECSNMLPYLYHTLKL